MAKIEQLVGNGYLTPQDCHPAEETPKNRTGRMLDAHLTLKVLGRTQELPDISQTRLFDRHVSVVKKMNAFVDVFIAWVMKRPTKTQKKFLSALHYKVMGESLSENKVNGLFKNLTVKAPVTTDYADACILMVQFGLAKFLPSPEDLVVIKFLRPENNESLEQGASELLNQCRKNRLNMQAHNFLRSHFSAVDEECHMGLVAECLEATAEKVLESLVAAPVNLGLIFNKISVFNFWLSIRCILDGKIALQTEDAPNEFDKIFDNVKGIKKFIGQKTIDPFLLRAVPQIIENELSDDASQETRRVKASAPLLILWLADRLDKEIVQERSDKEIVQKCTDEEIVQIKEALEQLDLKD